MVRLRRRREFLCVVVGVEVGEQERVYTVSTFILVRVSPSTLSVRRLQRRSPLCPLLHGFPLALLGYHPRLSMVRLRRRRGLLCVAVGAERM